jgi:hypothetical protein
MLNPGLEKPLVNYLEKYPQENLKELIQLLGFAEGLGIGQGKIRLSDLTPESQEGACDRSNDVLAEAAKIYIQKYPQKNSVEFSQLVALALTLGMSKIMLEPKKNWFLRLFGL